MNRFRFFPIARRGIAALGAAAVAAFLTLTPPAHAQNQDAGALIMDPVVVTARGYAAPQSETPGSIEVATSDDISAAPKGSLVDAISRLPGISRAGDSPWGQDVSIRGLSGPSIVVLVNGKRINTATDMNARLGFINPMDIERIEVLKGPVSALYGSGSTGGVINIITRKGDFSAEPEVRGRVATSFNSNPAGIGAYATVSAGGERVWGTIAAGLRNFDDSFGGDRSRVINSEYSDVQGRLAMGFKPTDNMVITLEATHLEGDDIGIPGGVSSMPAMAYVNYPRAGFTFVSADLDVDVDGRYLKDLHADIYYTRNERRVMVTGTPAPVQFINPRADHETLGGKVQGAIEAGEHTIVTGLDVWSWSVESKRNRQFPAGALIDKPTPDARQTSFGIFGEDNWKLNSAFTLNLGARLDGLLTKSDEYYKVNPPYPGTSALLYGDKDEFDLGWHLHAGLTWKMTESWSQSLLLASSYRAADIMERFKYINLGGGREMLGNPELDPEQSYYAEYGLRYTSAPFTADLRLFANFVTDYIAEKQQSPTLITLDNVDDARIFGAELEARWNFSDYFGLYGSVTALYGRDEEKNQPLAGVAPLTGTIGIDFNHDTGLWARLETVMTARQNRTPDGVDHSAGYMTVNFALGYAFEVGRTKHDISLTVDNLFDARYYNYLAQTRGYDVWEPGLAFGLNYSVDF